MKKPSFMFTRDGEIHSIGAFVTFDEADEAAEGEALWIADERTARNWLSSLSNLLEGTDDA